MAKCVRLCVNRDCSYRSFSSVNLLTKKEVAKKCGVSTRTIDRMLDRDPSFPKPRKPMGIKVHYIAEEVDQWLSKATSENAKSSYS